MSSCARCGLTQPAADLALCPRCLLDDEDSELPEPPPGLVLETEIGRGGMGRVFRGRQVRLDRTVAVKLLPSEASADSNSEARFEREARALARLTHPHIVAVHDFGVLASKERYLIMEFVPGGTLRERIPLSEADALAIGSQVCRALAYAHEQGIVHRDVKPDNILFDSDGHAKLADFGIARFLDPESSDTLTHPLHVWGTPGYVAPEALTGAPVSPQMDVFALGVLLQMMVRGQAIAGDYSGLTPALARCITRATATNPQDRPANGRELLEELERITPRSASGIERRALAARELPPDEQSWLRAVALTWAGATALSLHAFLVSVTPRSIDQGEFTALLAFGAEPLPDGRFLTQARFETVPTLVAAGSWAVAFLAYGLLRRHWRSERLEVHTPDQRLAGTRSMMAMAVILNALFALRLMLETAGVQAATVYIPILGGVLELIMLYLFWSAILEAMRIQRPLTREPLLWGSLAVSLVPPAIGLFSVLNGGPP